MHDMIIYCYIFTEYCCLHYLFQTSCNSVVRKLCFYVLFHTIMAKCSAVFDDAKIHYLLWVLLSFSSIYVMINCGKKVITICDCFQPTDSINNKY